MNMITNHLPTEELQALDAAHHMHPFTEGEGLAEKGARVITRANGVWITDSDGQEILDGMAGLWCVAIGYGRDELAEVAARQMRELPFYNTFFQTTHVPAIALAKKLAELAPDDLNHVFFAGSGSEANDTNIRMVRHYWAMKGQPERNIILSRKNAYHGSSMGSGSLGGMAGMHAQGGLPIPDIHHINQPNWWAEGGDSDPADFGLARARELETAIKEHGPERVAAFIGENNKLTGRISSVNGQSCTVELDSGGTVEALAVNIAGQGEMTTLSLRPERVLINPPADKYPNTFEAKVEELIYLGDHIRTRINFAGNDQFVVKVPNAQGHAIINEGGAVRVGWAMEDCRALDA